ncbi:hypothetical protein [Aeromonas phage Asp37]|nr:hypothetical protein [Aeromonas phage Asp37]
MPRMNLKPTGWRLKLSEALGKLPKPVAMFILERLIRPVMLIVLALFMAVAFTIFMLIIIVMAPFNPAGAHEIFRHILGRFGE